MAGDWTPLRDNIHDDPDVLSIANTLGVRDADLVVGKLTRFWAWASQHSRDGTLGVSGDVVDRIAKCKGLAAACLLVGWLVNEDGGLKIPKFDRWMSRSAKARLGEAKRKQINRGQADKCPDKCPDNGGQMSGHSSGHLSGQKRDHRTGQDRTEQTTTPSSSREIVRGALESAAAGDCGLTGEQKAVFEYLTLAEVGRLKATQLAMGGLSLTDARRVNDARKQAGKQADGRFISQLKAAAEAEKIRAERRAKTGANV